MNREDVVVLVTLGHCIPVAALSGHLGSYEAVTVAGLLVVASSLVSANQTTLEVPKSWNVAGRSHSNPSFLLGIGLIPTLLLLVKAYKLPVGVYLAVTLLFNLALLLRISKKSRWWRFVISLLFLTTLLQLDSLIQMTSVLSCLVLMQSWFSAWTDFFPKCFTFCEAILVSQMVSVYTVHAATSLNKMAPVFMVANLFLLSVIYFVPGSFIGMNILGFRGAYKFSILTIGWMSLTILFPFYLLSEQHLIFFLMDFMLETSRVRILCLWFGMLIPSVFLIQKVAKIDLFGNERNQLIFVRKLYHFLSMLLFLPVLALDEAFLIFGLSGALFLMILLEILRLVRFPRIYLVLERFLGQFKDEKDEGILTLTHIYLLLGCFLPIVLGNMIAKRGDSMISTAGIVVLGAADSFGALIGSNFGRNKWKDSKKTVEGSIAAFVSCVLMHVALVGNERLIEISIAAGLVCLVEAFTKQIDNLVLPLFYVAPLLALNLFL